MLDGIVAAVLFGLVVWDATVGKRLTYERLIAPVEVKA